jgi:hypothetical protein
MMDQSKRADVLADFIAFCVDTIKISEVPEITFINDTEWCKEHRTFGMIKNDTKEILVYVKNRNLADICRTVAHEMTHLRQMELGLIYDGSGETGSDIENEANEVAGIVMRAYGQKNQDIYE